MTEKLLENIYKEEIDNFVALVGGARAGGYDSGLANCLAENMAASFNTLDNDGIHACFSGLVRCFHRSHLMQHLHPCSVGFVHTVSGEVTPIDLHKLHFLCINSLHDLRIWKRSVMYSFTPHTTGSMA